MMQDQLEKSKAETEGIMKMKAEVERILEGLGKLDMAEIEVNGAKKSVALPMEEGLDVWEELEKEFG
jgi:mediator of RNA polymerase II transcription subunit 7